MMRSDWIAKSDPAVSVIRSTCPASGRPIFLPLLPLAVAIERRRPRPGHLSQATQEALAEINLSNFLGNDRESARRRRTK